MTACVRPPTLGVMQPYFLPYLGYFQLIAAVDRFVLYDRLNYTSGWINRNRIAVQGAPRFVTVPLRSRSTRGLISDVEISDSSDWRRQFLACVHHEYRRCPFFEPVLPLIEGVVNFETTSLSQLNCNGVSAIAAFLGIETDIVVAPQLEELERRLVDFERGASEEWDGRPRPSSRKVARLVELCRINGSRTYVNLIGGKSLYSRAELARHDVDIHFLSMDDIRYSQAGNRFLERLSIVDVLLNCGREATRNLLSAFSLE